jgi:hyperpolarization activated cyclic nucleotide-gated potassium channel 1
MSAKLDDFSPNTWVIRMNLQDEEIGTKYLASLYWAVATVLTVGYGDIHAETITERSLSIIWMMIGVAFYAFTIGIMTSVLARIDTRET